MEYNLEHPVTQWLKRTNSLWFTLYTAFAAFSLYTCIYAFRKTFPAATFEGMEYGGISYKVWLVFFQALGYGLSKFIGIKIISELKQNNRAIGILTLAGCAVVSWLLFGVVPAPYNIIFLFTNGLPLGMVWGIIFSYLEGRRITEVLGAALSISFIFSSGLCRSVGAYLLQHWSVSETWMPFVASLLFILPLLAFVWLLEKVPPPTTNDEILRTKRAPMSHSERRSFLISFLPGIILFVFCYLLLTTFRDFRDNFSAEVWESLGYGNSPAIFTQTEIPIAIAVLVIIGLMMFIRNNHLALMINHLIIASGMVIVGLATLLYERQLITGHLWMILIGLGLYLGYVPFNSIFFDRLIAAFKVSGTVGFIMYVADSAGYLGSITILFIKEFTFARASWVNVFITSGYVMSVFGLICIGGSMYYFNSEYKKLSTEAGVIP